MNIEITQLGYFIIPATLLLLVFLPNWLIPWTTILVPFQAASVFNIYLGSYPIGVQPGYFAGVAFVVSLFLGLIRKGYLRVPRNLFSMYLPLLFFVTYLIVSATFLPIVFERSVSVFPPREGISLRNLVPLHPSLTNVSQTVYMVFLFVFAVAVSLKIASSDANHSAVSSYVRSYLSAGLLVVFIGFYQLAATYSSVPFPNDLLYSNPVYGQGYEQVLAGIKRLSSTFTETSYAAYYLAGIFSFALWLYLFMPRSRLVYLVVCLFSGVALLLTTSTTAYLTLGAIVTFAFLQIVPRRGLVLRSARLAAIAAPTLVVVLVAAYLLSSFNAVASVIDAALFDKADSSSFVNRIGTVRQVPNQLASTGGLGVGWGSNRSSGLLDNTLSNAGLWGSALLVWFGLRVFKRVSRVNRTISKEQRSLVRAFTVSILAMLIAGVIAVPDLTFINFWLSLGVLIGVTLRAEKTFGKSSGPYMRENWSPR